MTFQFPQLLITAPVVITVAWMAVWYVQITMIALLGDWLPNSLLTRVFFFPVNVIVSFMEDRPQSMNDSEWLAALTWNWRAAFCFWSFIVRLIAFLFAVAGYSLFAITRRIVTMRDGLLTSYLFSFVQNDAGLLNPAEMDDLREQLMQAQTEAMTAQDQAHAAQRDLRIQRDIMDMVNRNGMTQSDLIHWMNTMTQPQSQMNGYGQLPSDIFGVGFTDDLGNVGEWVDFGGVFDDDETVTESEVEGLMRHLNMNGSNFRNGNYR